MKIAILGTRGIPNNYGGFEAFAENISVALANRGHEVVVFNSSLHPYKEDNFKNVQIIHCKDPENVLGTAGQFIYDLNCILSCRKLKPDIILQLGYTSSTIWRNLFPKNAFVITNMDGLEWKRSKYSMPVKAFLKQAEKWAVDHSNTLVADNIAIKDYLFGKYGVNSTFIPYPVEIPAAPATAKLNNYRVEAYQYNLVIARMEPENNIQVIIRAHHQNETAPRLLIVGSVHNRFAKQLIDKYASAKIVFLDSIYDREILSALRYYCSIYFHGHSVGGTNPSLIEAMSFSTLICAHDNEFNRSVLNEDSIYFSNEEDIMHHLDEKHDKRNFMLAINRNIDKVKTLYSPAKITDAYETLFLNAWVENETERNTQLDIPGKHDGVCLSATLFQVA